MTKENPAVGVAGELADEQLWRWILSRRAFLAAGGGAAAAFAAQGAAAGPVAGEDWFPFKPANDYRSPSVIGLADWLDKPAGRHGFLLMKGEGLVFEDGTAVKFWGSNVCNARVACPNEQADRWADKFAKYGVNLVRFHKFTWPGPREGIGSREDSIRLDESMAPRWDYFTAALAARGIYTGWSHIYGHRLSPADKDRVLAYDEIMAANLPWAHLRHSSIGLVNFARDLQDLNLALTRNMLNRTNAVTGKRYAEDASLAYIELQNEDDIFWGHTQTYMDMCPTYKRLLHRQFSEWLQARYGSQEKLEAAWGKDALRSEETLRAENIEAFASPRISSQISEAAKAGQSPPRRLLDNCRFLYETQNAFYRRFVEAIRETGYRGVVVGSCWNAGSGVSHYYNLHSDYLAGMIDRHNYTGGRRAMLSAPGSGIFGAGLQQAANRPFGMSEWKSTWSSPWVAEAPAIIAVYGLGLQGWDMSCEFASDSDTMTMPMTEFGTDSPADMGQYPALARMVHRGDVREGAVIARRRVSLAELAEGKLPFEDEVRQQGDIREFTGSVPREALAAGKIVIEFAERPSRSEIARLDRYFDRNAKVIRSTTGQLTWDFSGEGFFTVDTPGTQAVAGFTAGKPQELSQASIRLETPFAVVFVTSLDRRLGIDRAPRLLVQLMGRTANTGMALDPAGKVTERGKPPVLVEPVVATISLKRVGKCSVLPLDHDGRIGEERQPVAVRQTGGRTEFTLDGRKHRTPYYLAEFGS